MSLQPAIPWRVALPQSPSPLRRPAFISRPPDTTVNGQGTVPVLGYGCFFLLQEAEQKGNESSIYGEFSRGCRVSGTAGPNPGAGPGPYLIQLYDDPDSQDS